MENTAKFIYGLRTDYGTGNLDEKTARANPFEQFEIWLNEAIASQTDEPNAMVVTTVSGESKPSSRIVLLRGFDRNGLVFYTNYESQKGREIAENNHVALLFFWAKLERQIRIEGKISKISRQKSREYFSSRPRESQIGAWASAQSREIESRNELEEKTLQLEKKFANCDIPCPPFWGGYIVKPESFEFWQGRKSRLHDRLKYLKIKSGWQIERLSP